MLRLRGCSVVCPHLLAQGERHPLVPDGGTRLRRPTAIGLVLGGYRVRARARARAGARARALQG